MHAVVLIMSRHRCVHLCDACRYTQLTVYVVLNAHLHVNASMCIGKTMYLYDMACIHMYILRRMVFKDLWGQMWDVYFGTRNFSSEGNSLANKHTVLADVLGKMPKHRSLGDRSRDTHLSIEGCKENRWLPMRRHQMCRFHRYGAWVLANGPLCQLNSM